MTDTSKSASSLDLPVPSLFELERNNDVEAIAELVSKSDNPRIRARAAEILGDLPETADEPEALDSLVRVVKTDGDETVKASAIDALTNLEQIDVLLEALDLDVDESAANWAKAESFVADLEAEEPTLRMAVANVLGVFGAESAVDPLGDHLDDPNPRVRARIARALGKIGDPRAAGQLMKHLTGEPAGVRREVADALGYIGGEKALDGLLEAANDDSEAVRRTIASSLGQFGNTKPIDTLIELLEDDSDLVRKSATFSLIEILSNVSTERSDELRNEMVGKMSAKDDSSIVESLVEIIEEGTQMHQRRNATWMLGRVTGETNKEAAIEALIGALGDEDHLISQFAATSLAEIGGKEVETALIHHINTSHQDETIAMAAFALGKVGGDRAKSRLERLVDETESEDVRSRAFSALSKLGGTGLDF